MKKIVLVIGHNKIAQGAYNKTHKISEFEFNKELVYKIADKLQDFCIIDIVYRDNYKGAYLDLPNKINDLKPDYIISFHCNAFNKKAKGCEQLYYYKSSKGKLMAQILQDELIQKMNFVDRKIKPRNESHRGGYLLKKTNAACVITEPFFIDNDKEYKYVINNYDTFINCYVNAIKKIITI